MLRKALIVIITAVVFKSFLEYMFGKNEPAKDDSNQDKLTIFTAKQLEQFAQENKLYLAILGF